MSVRQTLDLDEEAQDAVARLEQRLTFERLIASLSTELIDASAEELDGLIEQALGDIGGLFSVDRAYLFRFAADRTTYSNTHEWVGEGVSREAAHLQQVPADHFPWLLEELQAGRAVHVPVTADLPAAAATERAEFMREGILSLALVPFGDLASPEGFIGFDSVRRQRHWPPEILLGLRLVGQMFSNAFRSREMSERLLRLAFHDPLTGMGNRRFLGEQLAAALERSREEKSRLAVILIDLDDFKLVNDSYGHSLGDEVLVTAAHRLCGVAGAGDIVGRLGGDEFVVIASGKDSEGVDGVSGLVARLFEAMLEPVELRGVSFALRMSVGIAMSPDDGSDPESLLRQADSAMYAAKAEGKNRFAFFTPRMTLDSRASLRLRHDLRLALERGEIVPHYQPRVDLASGRILGFEALARWHHPSRGLLMPAEFLGLAKHSGVIDRIDLGMLRHALVDLQRWRELEPQCRVSVNLDADGLYDERLIERLGELLAGCADGARGVELEITESSLMRDIVRASEVLTRLRQDAPRLEIAIDDFGTGYSSLGYIGRLPVNTIKVDRSFISGLASDDGRSARAVVHAIVSLAKDLDLQLVAEGVETAEQVEVLLELGCTEAQGYLFARPMPPTDALGALERGLRRPV